MAPDGPTLIYLLRELHLVGLGHLGQGILWSLATLPAVGRIVLHDHQCAGLENEATGLVTRHMDIGAKKTRIAAQWMEHFGWTTDLIERRFDESTRACANDPLVVMTALDSPTPRRYVHAAGFEHMIDIGVGHGPVDFEAAQLRAFARGETSTWQHPASTRPVDNRLLARNAYLTLASVDSCGAFELASASVAVPFVGAALGALAVAQVLRLGAMESPIRLMQIELGAPDMASCGALAAAPARNLGTVAINLKSPPDAT